MPYALLVWGGRHRYPNSRLYKHAACGTHLDERAYCPACKLAPPPEDILVERRRNRGLLRDDPVARALRSPHRLLEPVHT